jgi:signal transduction histidine kinase
MPGGGTLTLLAQGNADHAEITIGDTGVGISPENLARIFEPLYSTKAKGIGLGLSIAHEILGRHHGTLQVKSELGAGSAFIVRLPRAP